MGDYRFEIAVLLTLATCSRISVKQSLRKHEPGPKKVFKNEGFRRENKDLHVKLVKIVFVQGNIIVVKIEGSTRGLWDMAP